MTIHTDDHTRHACIVGFHRVNIRDFQLNTQPHVAKKFPRSKTLNIENTLIIITAGWGEHIEPGVCVWGWGGGGGGGAALLFFSLSSW